MVLGPDHKTSEEVFKYAQAMVDRTYNHAPEGKKPDFRPAPQYGNIGTAFRKAVERGLLGKEHEEQVRKYYGIVKTAEKGQFVEPAAWIVHSAVKAGIMSRQEAAEEFIELLANAKRRGWTSTQDKIIELAVDLKALTKQHKAVFVEHARAAVDGGTPHFAASILRHGRKANALTEAEVQHEFEGPRELIASEDAHPDEVAATIEAGVDSGGFTKKNTDAEFYLERAESVAKRGFATAADSILKSGEKAKVLGEAHAERVEKVARVTAKMTPAVAKSIGHTATRLRARR